MSVLHDAGGDTLAVAQSARAAVGGAPQEAALVVASDTRTHFAQVARSYDRLRGPGPWMTPVTTAMVEAGDLRGRRLLDVGCGTGTLLAALATHFDVRGTGIDAAAEMIDVARSNVPEGVDLAVGEVEKLPFADESFERATMTMVTHLLDRARAFPEILRVLEPRGRLVMTTTDPDAVGGFWLASLFPSFASIDRGRFPTADQLSAELQTAGFSDVACRPLSVERRFTRDEALAKLRGRACSTFAFVDDGEYRAGLERAEKELPDVVEYTLALLLVTADRD